MIEHVLALHTQADVESATADLLARWAGQAVEPDHPGNTGAAWAHQGAVGVYAPGLNRRDRLILVGDPVDAAEILRARLPTLPPSTRPLCSTELAGKLRELVPLREVATFGWMERRGAIPDAEPPPGYPMDWLDDPAEIEVLLELANPDAWVRPGEPGPLRWFAARHQGSLVSVAAEAWSARGVGFIGGVATDPAHRGLGLSTVVCGRLAGAIVARRGAVTLMVHADNVPAVRAYRRLGFDYRSVTALAPGEPQAPQ